MATSCSTSGPGDLNRRDVAWGIQICMCRVPIKGVTGGTVSWSRLAECNTLQGASGGIVTADTVVVRIESCTGQGVVVTGIGATAGADNGHDPTVVRFGRYAWVS